MLSAIWCHLYNFKNVKNTHGGVILSVTLEASVCNFNKSVIPPWVFSRFLNCTNGTESRKVQLVFSFFFFLSFFFLGGGEGGGGAVKRGGVGGKSCFGFFRSKPFWLVVSWNYFLSCFKFIELSIEIAFQMKYLFQF